MKQYLAAAAIAGALGGSAATGALVEGDVIAGLPYTVEQQSQQRMTATADVPAGAVFTLPFTVPKGARVSNLLFDAPSVAVEGVTYEDRPDGTLVKVTAKNTSQMRMRMTALVEIKEAP